jgi:hypothetical protein
MHTVNHSPLGNHLLAALPSQETNCLEPNAELVRLTWGQELYEASRKLFRVNFSTTFVVSLLNVLEDGECAGSAAVGHEGLLGTSLFAPNKSIPTP